MVAFLFNAVLAALAALAATPLFAVEAPAPAPATSALEAAAARPRLGFTTVVPLDEVELSVEELWVLVWLVVRWGESGAAETGRGGGSIWPLVLVVVVDFSLDAVRFSLAAVLRLACSIMPCIEAEMAEVAADAADFKGDAGLSGEVGRAIMLLAGDNGANTCSLTGERGSVRELWDRGDSTEMGFAVREAVRVGAAALARLLFFATGSVSAAPVASFSLSEAIRMSELLRFLPRVAAAGACGLAGDGILPASCRGGGGSGLSCDAPTSTEICLYDVAWVFFWDGLAVSCCSANAAIVILRMDSGMRFTRRSSLARRSAHCRAYPARSCRARSVTGPVSSVSGQKGTCLSHSLAAGCPSVPASEIV